MPISPNDFLDTITGVTRAETKKATSAVREIRLAVIDPAYTSGLPRVTFEGETTLSGKGYAYANYAPAPNDRVVMLPQGNSYIIIGAVGKAPAGGPGGGVTDHGALTGLGDDDHTQYLTQARGDARYFTESETTALLGGKANTAHSHAAADVSSGTLDIARVPTGTTASTVALGSHTHAASAINSGTLPVARGGTGLATVTAGNFVTGNGTAAMTSKTPAQVRTDIGATVQIATVNLSTDTASAFNSVEQWGTETADFTNPGRAVTVSVHFTGRLRYNLATPVQQRIGGSRVDISFDNGSTWQEGVMNFVEVAGGNVRNVPMVNGAVRSGTPTAAIKVRVMLEARQGSNVSETEFLSGVVTAYLIPT